MRATFVELPAFERRRPEYLSDDESIVLQQTLMARPDAGDVIPGTGGLRKFRFADPRRRKGKRGGLRVIYFHWSIGCQFWLFTLHDKDELSDLTAGQRRALKRAMDAEVELRRPDG